MGCQEPHQAQQGELQSPAPRREQAQAPEHSRGHQPENSSEEKDLGVLVDTKLSKSQGSALEPKMTNDVPGCIRQKYSHHVEGGEPFPLLSTGESVLGSSTQDRHGHIEEMMRLGHLCHEEKLRGILCICYLHHPEGKAQKVQSQVLFSGTQLHNHRQWAQTQTLEIPFEHQETFFHCEGHRALAQVTQSGCGVSNLGNLKSHQDMVLGSWRWHCSSRGLDQVTSRGPFQPQPFCDPVQCCSFVKKTRLCCILGSRGGTHTHFTAKFISDNHADTKQLKKI